MTKKHVISFEVRKDPNADPTRRYILRVMNNGTCIEAPRYAFLDSATRGIAGYIEEYGGEQKKFKVEINL